MSKERPIIFDAESVRAILDGSKTQTRRVVKPPPPPHCDYPIFDTRGRGWFYSAPDETGSCEDSWPDDDFGIACPYGKPGDRLWVREKFAYEDAPLDRPGMVKVHYDYSVAPYTANWFPMPDTGIRFRYNSQGVRGSTDGVWRSPIHMPRWASRITLEVVGVRVERLQDITQADAQAEGCTGYLWTNQGVPGMEMTPVDDYMERWDAINGKRAPWASNPWVWVVEFKRHKEAAE